MSKRISVKGLIHGVEFRSSVYELATRLNLHGWLCITSSDGAEILVQGQILNVESFIQHLGTETAESSGIDDIAVRDESSNIEYSSFEIRVSDFSDTYEAVSPEIAICPDCEQELFDPRNRRYLYPFINCSKCGPRFTITKDLSYNRPNTTMAEFGMCEHCEKEFNDSQGRYFRTQPIACPDCGPFVALREVRSQFPVSVSKISSIDCRTPAILKARRLLREGYILGIKSLGGFYLACDASNSLTLEELRDRKGGIGKPFALMASDVELIRSICRLSPEEEALLTGREKPIVLLEKKPQNEIAHKVSKWVAPHLNTLGVMLPYTPLQHLLLNQTDPILAAEPVPPLLVMTSGNFSEEPIAIDDEDALQRLAALADAFLVHNRDIYVRCDDSVVRVDHGLRDTANDPPSTIYVRRSRGYAPYAVQLPVDVKPTLAVGSELENTFCLAREQHAFISPHIGDMENIETVQSFEKSIQHLSHIFQVQPELVAYDLYSDSFTPKYDVPSMNNIRHVGVQHHHAHIVSCMIDNGLSDRRLIGLSFDGKGYGSDGMIWGGEVLLASFSDFERFAHLEYLPIPSSDTPLRVPWRIAAGYAHALDIDIVDLPFFQNMDKQVLKNDGDVNSLLTSSMGYLFDAVSSLIGVRNEVTYEAQASLELEALAKPFMPIARSYPYTIDAEGVIQLKELLNAIIQDIRANESIEMIAASFHKTVADIAIDSCKSARVSTGLNEVVLSGDLWQNQILLNLVRDGLKQAEFVVYFHQQIPTNDGGLALGQAVIANCSDAAQEFLQITKDGKLSSSKNL